MSGARAKYPSLLFLLPVLAGCLATGSRTAGRHPFWPGSISTPDGYRASEEQLRTKVVLVVVFGLDTPVSPRLLVQLQNLYVQYRQQGFLVVGYAVDTADELLAPYCRGLGVEFPVVAVGREMSEAIKVVPQLHLFGRGGTHAGTWIGLPDPNALSGLVERLLNR
ncbi:MAG: hypothetical protein D6806_18875 [Deltaproteobacteria bacterium]|nr:MAG: hypothetical protein D6806_18875 [Deltaproteobacteria bacterium]